MKSLMSTKQYSFLDFDFLCLNEIKKASEFYV